MTPASNTFGGELRRRLRFLPETLDLILLPVLLQSMRLLGLTARPGMAVSPPESVLVISVEGLGDTILSVPLLRATRQMWPQAQITLLVSTGSGALFRHCPYVDRVLEVDRSGYLRTLPHVFSIIRLLYAARFVWKELRGLRFHVAINTDPWTNITGTAFMAWLSGASERIAVIPEPGMRRTVNRAEERLYSTRIVVDGILHRVRYSLEIPRRQWGAHASAHLELWPSADDEVWALNRLGCEQGAAPKPLIILGIGGSERKRLWPAPAFVAAARRIGERIPCRFAIVGNRQEADLADQIAAELGPDAINLCREEINRTIAFLGHAAVYFGNDTGSMHMAAARGVPCLVLSCHPEGAPSSHFNAAERYHPWNVNYRYLQARPASTACGNGCVASEPHCILGITPDRAADTLWTALKGPGGWAEERCDRMGAIGG